MVLISLTYILPVGFSQEIDARHTLAANGIETTERQAPHLVPSGSPVQLEFDVRFVREYICPRKCRTLARE